MSLKNGDKVPAKISDAKDFTSPPPPSGTTTDQCTTAESLVGWWSIVMDDCPSLPSSEPWSQRCTIIVIGYDRPFPIDRVHKFYWNRDQSVARWLTTFVPDLAPDHVRNLDCNWCTDHHPQIGACREKCKVACTTQPGLAFICSNPTLSDMVHSIITLEIIWWLSQFWIETKLANPQFLDTPERVVGLF